MLKDGKKKYYGDVYTIHGIVGGVSGKYTNVISIKPKNKKLSKKDKEKKVKAAIETKKQVKKLTSAAKKASKKKIKVDPKIAKMSDEELAKLCDET